MDVILVQDVERLGKAGQRVSVKGGFARNFLFPRRMAVGATRGAGAAAQAQLAEQVRAAAHIRQRAEELARRLEEAPCTVAVTVGEQGKLHGAVTAADIVQSLQQRGIPLEKHQVQIPVGRALAHLGEHQVAVKLHPEVKATLRVHVVRR